MFTDRILLPSFSGLKSKPSKQLANREQNELYESPINTQYNSNEKSNYSSILKMEAVRYCEMLVNYWTTRCYIKKTVLFMELHLQPLVYILKEFCYEQE
jgi:hypothetical protein